MKSIARPEYFRRLEEWKGSFRRKPLLLEGARQVGKTWLMQEFAASHFGNVVYARFDKNRQLRNIFDLDFDVDRIIHELEIAFKTRIVDGDTVLIFDEIQSCKNALTSLKYFCEDRPGLHVMAAGSLLGLEFRDDEADVGGDDDYETTGFPVGKVNEIDVHPLSFVEFVRAVESDSLAEEIEAKNYALLNDFSARLTDLLKHYFVIGGMPEAVSTYLETRNFLDVAEVHREILSGYARDFAKHAPKRDVHRVAAIWKSLPVQLAQENKKFSYSFLGHGARGSNCREPIAWLVDAGLVHLCRRVRKPGIPLASYADAAFKMFALDVGLLSTMSSLDSAVVLDGSRIFEEFKGSLTEQYVHQQLVSGYGDTPFYWSSDDSRSEIDFLLQRGMGIAPVEAKAAENVRAKSFKGFIQKHRPEVAYRFSLLPYKEDEIPLEGGGVCKLVNIPLYALK